MKWDVIDRKYDKLIGIEVDAVAGVILGLFENGPDLHYAL